MLAYDKTVPTYESQRGEDRILQAIFQEIGVAAKWCVEFGATDGKHYSNTWYWINHQNWQSVQIEASRDAHLGLRSRHRWSYEALTRRYKNNSRVVCLNEWVTTAGARRLDALLARTALPREFDLLSIDVDSNDYAIWESLVEYSPRVVIIEHNKTIPIEVSFHSNAGSSLRALYELGKKKGYALAAANDLNGIFVRQDLFSRLGIRDNSPEELWRDHECYRMYLQKTSRGLVFQGPSRLRWVRGYDGTLPGQFRQGRYVVVEPGQSSVKVPAPARMPYSISGFVRHWWWSLVR